MYQIEIKPVKSYAEKTYHCEDFEINEFLLRLIDGDDIVVYVLCNVESISIEKIKEEED